jgi:hypothetical protein
MTVAYKYPRTSLTAFTRPYVSCLKLRLGRVVTSPGSVEEELQGQGTEEAGEAGLATGTAFQPLRLSTSLTRFDSFLLGNYQQ